MAALLGSCSGDDATDLREAQAAASPSGADGGSGGSSGGGETPSAGSSGEMEMGGSSGSSSTEGNTGGLELGPAGAAGQDGEAPPEPPPASEYWSDGVELGGAPGTREERFLGVAVDGSDAVYAVGFVGAALGDNRSMLIRKFNAAGELDQSFGGANGAGTVVVDWSAYSGTPDDPATADVNEADPSIEEAADVAVQSSGGIIVAGRVEDPSVAAPDATTPVDIVVFRLNPDGSLDTTFADAGRIVLDSGGPADLAYGIEVDSSDRIYVFGHGQTSDPERSDQDRYTWRLTPDGALDASFANGGVHSFDIPQGTSTLALNDNARRGAVVPPALGGGVVLGGYTNVAGRNQIVLMQLDDSGAPKTGFSGDGIVRLAPFATGMAEAYGVTLQSDGSVVTTGYGNVDLERGGGAAALDMVSFRVRADGSYDPSWGIGGAAIYDPAGAEDRGRALHVLPDDRVIIAGTATVAAGNKDAMLLLLEADGSPAADFAPGTHKSYDFGGVNEEFRAVDVAPSGKFVAAAGFVSGRAELDAGILVLLPIPGAAE